MSHYFRFVSADIYKMGRVAIERTMLTHFYYNVQVKTFCLLNLCRCFSCFFASFNVYFDYIGHFRAVGTGTAV